MRAAGVVPAVNVNRLADASGARGAPEEGSQQLRFAPPVRVRSGGGDADSFAAARQLISSRRNASPRRLEEPGPGADQLDEIISLAAAAPDHGLLTPWRFILVPTELRHHLAEVFALALIDRCPGATLEQTESARERAHRAPLLLIAIACLEVREPDTPMLERMVSMDAAIQNVLLGAHAIGFGAGLTSGRAMSSPRLRDLCRLGAGEVPVCCISMGTVSKRRPASRLRPVPSLLLSTLALEPAAAMVRRPAPRAPDPM